jgi:protein TonB
MVPPANDSANRTTTAPPTSAVKKKGKVSVAAERTSRSEKMVADASGYYNYAEVSPAYKGGQSAIENYVNNNIEGTVNVRFGIDENGNIANISTLGTKIGYGLEEEAVRVIKDMGKWTPGMVKGKNVKTWMILPISYRIEG